MTKQTKMILGVGVLAVAGYLLWKQSSKKSFANLTASGLGGAPTAMRCCGHKSKVVNTESPSGYTFTCCGGDLAPESNGLPCSYCDEKRKKIASTTSGIF